MSFRLVGYSISNTVTDTLQKEGFVVPVLYLSGVYYKLGQGSGGKIKITQDGEVIIHGDGDTAGASSKLYNVRFISDYGNGDIWPKEMWIDDLEIFDGWIADSGG